jgi:AcrR family transcriptional regulator
MPEPAERRALREAAGVPLAQIAAACGVSVPTIYRAEAGTHKMRSTIAALRYERILEEMRERIGTRLAGGLTR